MVHGATYATTPQQIEFRLQIALSTLLGMYLRNADVTNAFTEADHPKQIYYMCCDQVFKYWWKTHHPDIPLPPMWLLFSSITSRSILKARASGPSVVMRSLSHSSSRTLNTIRVCTTAFSMMSLFYSFAWSTIYPLHANLRKCIPSYFTCWTITRRYQCCNMA
jgi:hypothetical protein